jgi:hypothetical protein
MRFLYKLFRLLSPWPWHFLFSPSMKFDLIIFSRLLEHRCQLLRHLSLLSLRHWLLKRYQIGFSRLRSFVLFCKRLKVHVVDNGQGRDVIPELSSNELPVRGPALTSTLPRCQPFCGDWEVLCDGVLPLGIGAFSLVLLTLRWPFSVPTDNLLVGLVQR